MTDHASRAVELLDTPAAVSVQAGIGYAILALAESTGGQVVKLTGPQSVADPRPATSHNSHSTSSTSHMAEQWHAASDHAADGVPFGGPLCNCERVAARARSLGWGPVQRPRWDDDLVRANREAFTEEAWGKGPDHPEIVTERGQERPNGAGDVQDDVGHRGSVLYKAIRRAATVLGGPVNAHDVAAVRSDLLAALVQDPTHTTPITVHGIPAEDHHADRCAMCRAKREDQR